MSSSLPRSTRTSLQTFKQHSSTSTFSNLVISPRWMPSPSPFSRLSRPRLRQHMLPLCPQRASCLLLPAPVQLLPLQRSRRHAHGGCRRVSCRASRPHQTQSGGSRRASARRFPPEGGATRAVAQRRALFLSRCLGNPLHLPALQGRVASRRRRNERHWPHTFLTIFEQGIEHALCD
jgi:hypothetical protein